MARDDVDAAFATLTPINPLARMAFSDLYSRLIAGRQDVDDRERAFRIGRNTELVSDRDVEAFKRHIRRRAAKKADADADQVSDTLPDTQSKSEDNSNDSGPGLIWRGHFILSFRPDPSRLIFGWTVGKRKLLGLERISSRLLMSLFVYLPLPTNINCLFGISIPTWLVIASGVLVTKRLYILNIYTIRISSGVLQYEFRYTEFANTPGYPTLRDDFISRVKGDNGFVELPEIPIP
ncbi:uncharacterized protein B0T15DRAFT_165847 [Chaetomium strumarium]|uniref:Uncharacterized protein n=1 Tax=Chaetomium strumarium TaxID=1170767 RepID=A0AAJ0M323_9PEZI|nr:hypothetical protein B0T15DRAFT_165847 [Chaetomium strumarium]